MTLGILFQGSGGLSVGLLKENRESYDKNTNCWTDTKFVQVSGRDQVVIAFVRRRLGQVLSSLLRRLHFSNLKAANFFVVSFLTNLISLVRS